MMIRAAHALAEARRIPQLGGTIQVTSDYTPVFGRIRDGATTDWKDKIAVDRFVGKGGRFVRGKGRIIAPGTVAVDNGQELVADRAIVIAAGTSAAIPPIEGLADTPYWTNREIVATKQVPESMVVVGGGAVGLELAQAFSASERAWTSSRRWTVSRRARSRRPAR
jgi:pyruvate/2-oxoglutarate dehydrogenase complex dihydrolipoamide dehydrogenase (E3) component